MTTTTVTLRAKCPRASEMTPGMLRTLGFEVKGCKTDHTGHLKGEEVGALRTRLLLAGVLAFGPSRRTRPGPKVMTPEGREVLRFLTGA